MLELSHALQDFTPAPCNAKTSWERQKNEQRRQRSWVLSSDQTFVTLHVIVLA